MKLSKNLGRIATTFLATAMLASVSAVPAFAANSHGDYSQSLPKTVTIDISKKITKPNNVFLPDEEFQFTIAPLEEEAAYADGAKIHMNPVEGGEGGTVEDTIKSYPGAALVADNTEIVPNGTGESHTVELADTLKIDLDASKFSDPDTYQFLITEKGGDYETGYAYGAQYMVLDVIVTRVAEGTELEEGDNGMRIYGYELYSYNSENGTVGEGKVDCFENDYAIGSNNEDQTKDLELTKQVTGDFATSADEAKHYQFTIKIENASAGDKDYNVVIAHASDCASNDRGDSITKIDVNTPTQIVVAEGDTFHIDGLTTNDKVTIEESEYTGFTTSNKVATDSQSFDEIQADNDRESVINSMNSSYKVEFTNDKTASPATGIVMDIAPYVLLVVVAAAGCFVFLRKRRED